MPTIIEFFNPHSLKHLCAFEYLVKFGVWPPEFPNAELEFPEGWKDILQAKMASAWRDSVIRGLVWGYPGLPSYEGEKELKQEMEKIWDEG